MKRPANPAELTRLYTDEAIPQQWDAALVFEVYHLNVVKIVE